MLIKSMIGKIGRFTLTKVEYNDLVMLTAKI